MFPESPDLQNSSVGLSANGPFRILRRVILLFVLGRLVSSPTRLVAGASKIKSEEWFCPMNKG